MKTSLNLSVVLFLITCKCFSQGFINLNFEQAVFQLDLGSPYYPYAAVASNAIPGWTAYIRGNPQNSIWSNSISLGEPAVSIHDNNDIAFTPIEGMYFILLQSSTAGDVTGSSGIGQTGTIPASALSLTFWGNFNGVLSFNGQPITYSSVGTAPIYFPYYSPIYVYQVDVSAYAGQMGELLFSAPYGTGAFLDNIQFSTSAVPEPSTLALLGFGAAMLGACRQKRLK